VFAGGAVALLGTAVNVRAIPVSDMSFGFGPVHPRPIERSGSRLISMNP